MAEVATPRAICTVIDNNQPGWTSIVESDPNVTLDVGEELVIAMDAWKAIGDARCERDALLAERNELVEISALMLDFIDRYVTSGEVTRAEANELRARTRRAFSSQSSSNQIEREIPAESANDGSK